MWCDTYAICHIMLTVQLYRLRSTPCGMWWTVTPPYQGAALASSKQSHACRHTSTLGKTVLGNT